jgi:hypothetical protein
MNEALILEKLDNLASEIQALKSEVQTLKEAKQAPATSAQSVQSALPPALAAFEGKYNEKDLNLLIENVLVSVNDINSILFKLKAGNELAKEIEPIAQQFYPHFMRFFAELDGQVNVTDVAALLRNLVTAVPAMNEGVGFLKMGIELKDDLIPVAQILYPKVVKLLNDVQQGIDKSNGVIKVAGTAVAGARNFTLSEAQTEKICRVIENLDFEKIQPVSPFGAIKQLMDPDIQKSLGAVFMVLQAMGACLQVIQNK